MRISKTLILTAKVILLLAVSGSAQTAFLGGNFESAASWDNGLPVVGSEGTIAVDGTWAGSTTGFGTGTVVNHTAGILTAPGTEGFNMNGQAGGQTRSGTWNQSGGSILGRYFLSNGTTSIINLSGGSWEMTDQAGTQHMGVANGGTLNISGTATLDAAFATVPVQVTEGTINIATDWTGAWTWGIYAGSEWRNHFIAGEILFDGAVIDGPAFDANFHVTDGGQTLALISVRTFFSITEIDYSPLDTTLTLTWESRKNLKYIVKYSADLVDWDGDIGDDIGADPGDTTTKSFNLSGAGLAGVDALFFRVEIYP